MTHRLTVIALAVVGLAACSAGTSSSDEAPATSTDLTAVTPDGDDTDEVVLETGPTTLAEPDAAATPPTTTPPTTETDEPSPSASCVDSLDLSAVAALTVWPAVGPGQWDDATDAVDRLGVGGLVLFEPQASTAADVELLLAELEAASHHGLLIATDEEGGVVQRLSIVGELASQRSLGSELGPGDDLGDVIRAHGAAIRALGVDIVFGPVVDVAPEVGDTPLSDSRFFPGGPGDVAALASIYVDAWNDAGLIATLKHFPGHGSASADTHDGAATTPELDALEPRDLVPYRVLSDRVADGAALVMVGHLTVPDLTDGEPATRSPAAVDLLRSIPGYRDAVVVSDALGMGAVGLDEADASVAALAAGIDVVIFTRTERTEAVIEAIVDAIATGDLDENELRASARRVMALLERDGHRCGAPAT